MVLRLEGSRRPAAAKEGAEELDGRDSCVWVGLEYIAEAGDGGKDVSVHCARRKFHHLMGTREGTCEDVYKLNNLWPWKVCRTKTPRLLFVL